MKKLSTIQKREKLNDVFAVDEIGPGILCVQGWNSNA